MAGLKPPELTRFYAKLHARGMDAAKLADAVGRSRSIITKILNGSKRRGPAWGRLSELLTMDEIALLDVAHRHTWNNKRTARRPRWTPILAAQLRGEKEAA